MFQPEHALIIQNKDELKIPLILETIPAPQEFRDAIESLSPEQQAFCKAYRKMQLAGSLFAVAVVQIKPQLERLLNLPHDALTKEVKMCQDLMSLFIEYVRMWLWCNGWCCHGYVVVAVQAENVLEAVELRAAFEIACVCS